jgi:uncharacterized protein YjiS (DUF1127 family)
MAISQLFSAWLDGVVNYLARRAAIVSLHELDDRALRDIGLQRSQIDAAVRGFIHLPRPNAEAMTAFPAISLEANRGGHSSAANSAT